MSAHDPGRTTMTHPTYRLVTRSDFDGLVCAALLEELGMIDDILFVHPKDMQDGLVEITHRDITTNLPYVAEAHLAFDHHHSETVRVGGQADNHVIDADAPSAARVVWRHYGGVERFGNIDDDLMTAVDQADSARYSIEEILAPEGWTLLNYLMDARTGLGRFRHFRISNYQLMMQLIPAVRTKTIDEILAMPDVLERVELYDAQQVAFREQLRRIADVRGDVVLLNLREEDVIHAGNRFMVYALFPDQTVSIHQMWGKGRQNTVFAVGKSIVDRSSAANIGELMLANGGGGHHAAGTCQVDHADADRVRDELVDAINAAGRVDDTDGSAGLPRAA